MNSDNFFSAVPNFVSGAHALQTALVGAAFVITLAGLVTHVIYAMLGRNLAGMFGSLIRLALIPIIIIGLQSWGDLLVGAVNGLVATAGGNGSPANVFQAYQAAIALKLGTAAAAANIQQATNGFSAPVAPDAGGSLVQPQALNGVTLTAYGYPGDSTPDGNSSQGSGAFPFDTAPGSLIAGYSTALSPDMAKAYNVQPGQQFTVTTSGGQSYTLLYADKTADYLTGRVDIYDPQQLLGNGNDNAFSQSVTSFNDGPVVQGQTGMASIPPNPGGSIGDQILWAITLGLSWVAEGVIWGMTIIQQVLYLVQIAISPIFIACLMVPALTFLARKFFLTLVGICLWPLAWAICNLVTVFLINLAVNTTGNGTISMVNGAAVIAGPLAGLSYLLVLAIWTIGSTLAAPLFIGILLGSGGDATAAVFGATLGAATLGATRLSSSAAGGPVGVAAAVGTMASNGGSALSAMSNSRMNGSAPNFARRPEPQTEKPS